MEAAAETDRGFDLAGRGIGERRPTAETTERQQKAEEGVHPGGSIVARIASRGTGSPNQLRKAAAA